MDGVAPGVVVVARGYAHAGLFPAVAAHCRSRHKADIREMAISVVPIKIIGSGIVCDEQIRSSIVVEVAPYHAQAVVSRAFHAPGFRNAGDPPSTVVIVPPFPQAL